MFTDSEKKLHFKICVVLILFFEAVVTAICFYQSVDEYFVKVIDDDGNVLYYEQCLTRHEHANAFKRAEATRTSENDVISAGEISHTFPFVSWACFAICIPLGIHLFYSLAILKFESSNGPDAAQESNGSNGGETGARPFDNRIEKIIDAFGRMHHNMIGGIAFLFFLGLGMLTTFLSSLSDAALQLLIAYKGYIFAGLVLVGIFFLIRMVLNHLLKRDAIIQQAEVEKAYALGRAKNVPLLEAGKPLLPDTERKEK